MRNEFNELTKAYRKLQKQVVWARWIGVGLSIFLLSLAFLFRDSRILSFLEFSPTDLCATVGGGALGGIGVAPEK